MTTTVEYDPNDNSYVKITKVGDMVVDRQYMTFQEYQDWQTEQLMKQYWNEKNSTPIAPAEGEGLLSKIPGFNEISRKLESLMGKPEIKITPTGSADLTFQVVNNYRKDPSLDVTKRSVTTFDFDENIQISLNAKIGDLIDFDLNWNTQATFDFENQIKLKYEGKEDDIIQLLEAADISFPLNTTLIKGSQQLFGFHTKLKFGKLTVDAVVSQKETSTENLQVKGGASAQEFEIRADEYEDNRHYFISQYFRDNYNKALSTLPVVNSNIKIIRMEVWRTNVGAAVTNNRNILALTDLGEANPQSRSLTGIGTGTTTTVKPSNDCNNLIMSGIAGTALINTGAIRSINNVTSYMQGLGFASGRDYEKVESARLLNSSEYTYNSQLGFISLTQPLSNDQILAVAFQYQVIGDTTVYQVGELTTDGVNDPNTLVVKLLKGTTIDPHNTLWKLMMKNVYFLKSTQISRENFRFNVLYESPDGGVGIGYFTEGPQEGKPLIEVLGLDRMDATLDHYMPDGVFDWMDSAAFKGGLIQASTGRVFFPYIEPFGKDLREMLGPEYADQYCYDSLYTMTQTLARQYADKNKFYLEGYYSSTVSGEISLGYSVTKGSVTVTAGGMPLTENVDYTVDYTMGTVRITNESILSSGTPISVSSENNSFSMMTKTMLGLHLNYEFNPDFNLGATVMNLREKPLTQKNNFGEEPTSNSIWGLDLNYRHEVPFITKLIDKLPGISTKETSTLTLQTEFAHFIPGMASTGSKDGDVSYIDDFEGAESSIDLKGPTFWHLASTPQDHATALPLFPESAPGTGLGYGMNRARLSWYRIDNLFYSSSCPDNITEEDRSKPYARRILEQEVFPNKDLAAGEPTTIYELNLGFYPEERGPYNYDVAGTGFSAGLNADGTLKEPATRWGGIMRSLDYTDFETQNIETIEFWLMDPFMNPETGEHDDSRTGGKLYFNLGDISEDILRDGRKFFENGLPTGTDADAFERNPVDTTIWGRVPKMQSIVNAFDNNESARKYQDVGYDGLGSTLGLDGERSFFADYVNSIAALYGTESGAYRNASADPSGDDFRYYRSTYNDENDVKINDRYKYYNNPEGNSIADADNTERYSSTATSYPNVEDINKDNTLSEAENYYEYAIDLRPEMMVIGQNHIVDIQEANNVQLANGTIAPTCRWYQFSIPIREPDRTVGSISGYQSIRFIRMFLQGFQQPVILRFATLELVYGTWRKYTETLLQPGDYPTGTGANTTFTLGTVNIEENGSRKPVPYVLPPGIEREEWYSSNSSYTQLDEQSIMMDIGGLAAGDARAIYRNMQYDLRYYGKLKMFVHAEKKYETDPIDDGDLSLFVRLGSDYNNNYYEYEVPLKLTPWGTGSDEVDAIWPSDNNVEIDLRQLTAIKTNRNKLIRAGNSAYSNTMLYSEFVGGRKYTVLGTPNLGKVKVIIIGVRNPRKERLGDGNDMEPKSAIVWLNELRLSDYTNRGGWAAMALARSNLADVGNLSLYGAYKTAGFGNLEDNLMGIELVNTFNFQTTLNFELGKFLPEEWGVRIPLYLDYNKEIGSPEYNPLDPDVVLREDLSTYQTAAERDSIRRMTQQRKSTTNLTLTNMHKERVGKSSLKPHFYDFENFSFSYAYSGERSSDEDLDHYHKDQHRGGLTYNFSLPQPKQFKPFDKMKPFQSKYLKIIKDFNIYYQPKSFNFTTEVYRDIEETLLRNKSAALVIIKPTYFKQFTWRRDYGLQYDLSRSFHIQYSANANANIEEPPGMVETHSASDSIWRSILDGGTMQNFQQTINANWDLPIGKLPFMDFLRVPLTYRTTYNFFGSTQALASQGSILQNSSEFTVNATATMQSLYNKVPLIKKSYAPRPDNNKKNDPKGKDRDKDRNKLDPKRGLEPGADLSADSRKADSLRREEIKENLRQVGYFTVRLLTGVKSARLQYTSTTGSRLPGYMGEATIFGLDPSAYWTPGVNYVLGSNESIVETLIKNDLLTHDTLMNTPHENIGGRQFSLGATVEPIRDMKIEVTCVENYTSREEYYYKYLTDRGYVDGPLSHTMTGTYTATAWSFRTAFRNSDDLFQQFLDNRSVVATRLAAANPDARTDQLVLDSTTGLYFPAGYSPNQQTVLLTAFLSTYLGDDAAHRSFSPFLNMPLPNWTINYNGLNKVKFLKKWFTNISLSHRYASTYTIGGFYTDAAISNAGDSYDYGVETVLNSSGDYIAPVSMEGVSINEQFNPLIKLRIDMVNNFQLNLSMQRNRMMALSFTNNQLTETSRNGLTIGAGYRFKDVAFSIKTGSKTHNFKSDIVLQFNLTHNDNMTLIRKINQGTGQISSGSKVWMAELRAEYALSSTLTMRAFFQTNINTPYISNAYPNSTTKGGITIMFSF